MSVETPDTTALPVDPGTPSDPGQRRVARRVGLARWALLWEALWPALGPAFAVVGVFLALALFDVLPLLAAWPHAVALAAFAGVLGLALWRARAALRLPGIGAGRRRLERDSGFAHRPLTQLDDRQLAGAEDAVLRAVWSAHQRRLAAALARVRLGWPRAGLARIDRRAYRALIALLVVVAAASAGPEWRERLVRAFKPGVSLAATPPGTLDLWITPPAYTGLPPMLPRPDHAGALAVPAGSTLLAQVSGGSGQPRLLIDAEATPFEAVDAKSFRVGATIEGGQRLVVEQGGRTLGAWTLEVVPDRPPTVTFAEAPSSTRRAALRLDYAAEDDYGLAAVGATVRRAQRPEGAADDQIDLPLPLAGPLLKDAKGSSYHDLTAHPWAGLPVKVQLKATDASGLIGLSDEIDLVLPERHFSHPVARAIIEQRKTLVGDPQGQHQTVARVLSAISAAPTSFSDDIVVFLALRLSSLRLAGREGPTPANVDGVQSLLWDTALRIEDGRLSLAEREMRALQQRLQDALANQAPDAEIEKLIQELQAAIDRFLQAMMEQAMRNPPDPRQRPDRNAQRIERNDLQRMLDQARQMARTGARDQAREMLQRLQELLENLRAGQPQMQAGEGEGEGEGQEMMRGLQDLMQKQQGLTDRTFRRSQQSRPGQRGQQGQQGQQGRPGQPGGQQADGDDGMAGDGMEQDSLRRQLGEMMRQLSERFGNIPNGFGRAERAMRDAADALQRGQSGRALRPQMDALDQLRSGARELMQQMMDQMAQQQGEGEGSGEDPSQVDSQAQQARDPAGRPLNNGLNGLNSSDVNIPAEAELQRSREILEELLRRAGERFRPQLERDYIERLLRRF